MKVIGLTELRRRVARMFRRTRQTTNRARFLREVREAEAEYAAGRWTEFQDGEALIRDLKT